MLFRSDMMRVIEHGEQVHMVMSETETLSVDTPAELQMVSALLSNDPSRELY